MKYLIISITTVSLLIGSWLIFFSYSSKDIDTYTQFLEDEVLPAVEAEHWDESSRLMKKLDDDWHKYKKTALLFLDTQTINEIDYSLARAEKYVKSEDVSNSSG